MSGADGRAWYSGGGKCHNSPRAPLFLPPGFAGSAGQRGREDSCRAFSQRSGAPGDIRSPADGRKQAGFTSAVKRSGRRASGETVQRVRSRRDVASLGRRCNGRGLETRVTADSVAREETSEKELVESE